MARFTMDLDDALEEKVMALGATLGLKTRIGAIRAILTQFLWMREKGSDLDMLVTILGSLDPMSRGEVLAQLTQAHIEDLKSREAVA